MRFRLLRNLVTIFPGLQTKWFQTLLLILGLIYGLWSWFKEVDPGLLVDVQSVIINPFLPKGFIYNFTKSVVEITE